MNFVITRAEVSAITGIRRTHTFELQRLGLLKVISVRSKKSWFSLKQVLTCAAELHGLAEPDDASVSQHAATLLEIRLKSQKKCK